MQRHLLKLALLFLMQCSLVFASEGGPLKTSLPDDWKLEYTETNGFDFYIATPKEAGDAVLFFNKCTVTLSPGDIPAALRKMADDILKKSEGYIELKIISNTSKVRHLDIIFMMTINGQIWAGHFQGTTEQWTQALGLLKSIKLVR
jgi:hypothetical protein